MLVECYSDELQNSFESKTAFLLIIFGNRKRWNRGMVNGMQHFLEWVELEEYSIYSVYSTSEGGIAGRAGIAGIVVIDLDGLRTFIPKQNDFCSI